MHVDLFQRDNKLSFPPTYEACIADFCDPSILQQEQSFVWDTLLKVCIYQFGMVCLVCTKNLGRYFRFCEV